MNPVSNAFGYGLLDAYSMVQLALLWKPLPSQHICELDGELGDRSVVVYDSYLNTSLEFGKLSNNNPKCSKRIRIYQRKEIAIFAILLGEHYSLSVQH